MHMCLLTQGGPGDITFKSTCALGYSAHMSTASVYLRLSKQATGTNLSLRGMEDDVRALCEREGLHTEAVHVDDGLSGGFRDRPAFQAWIADAREGRAEALVTFSVDRLTREGLPVAAVLLDISEGKDPGTGRRAHAPVRIMDTQGIDSEHGDHWRLAFVLKAEIARSERERMRQRSADMHRRAREDGRWGGGIVPYGYRVAAREDGSKTLELEPDEAAWIRQAVNRVLNGEALGRVARWLTHAGSQPRRAQAWTRTTLGNCLTGTVLMGVVSHKGIPVRDPEGHIVAPYPAIVSEAENAALRASLKPKVPGPRKGGRKPSRLLSGLLSCHSCARPMRVGTCGGRPCYRCAAQSDGRTCERPVTIGADAVEAYVTEEYLELAGPLPMHVERTVISGVDDVTGVEGEISALLAEMATQADADSLVRLQELQRRRDELAEGGPVQRTEIVDTGLTGREWWEGAHLDDKRDTLAGAFWSIEVHPGRPGPRGFDASRVWLEWSHDGEWGD